MSRCAIVVGPAPCPPDLPVAGVPLLLRTLLSLQQAGIEQVELIDLPEPPRDPRLRLRFGPCADAIIVPFGRVWLPEELARLVRGESAPGVEAGRATEALLRSRAKPTDGLISRWLNRPLSTAITRRLLAYPVTPNQMTLVAAAIGALAVAAAARGWLLLGALLLHAHSVLDGCDGELARLKFLQSRFGEWLDQVCDDFVNLGFLTAVGWQLGGWAWALALVAAGGHVAYQVSLYAGLIWRGGGRGSVTALRWHGQGGASATGLRRLAEDLGRRDFCLFLYLPCALFGWLPLALGWQAAIFLVSGAVTSGQWLLAGGPQASR